MIDPCSFAEWSFPVPIYFGEGRVREIPEICKKANIKNPLLVTDCNLVNLPLIGKIVENIHVAKLNCQIFSEISPNPTDIDVLNGKAVFDLGGHDGVVVVGGGSGMDGGKAISLVAGNNRALWSFDYDIPPTELSTQFTPLICVPTTAGTGAETDSTCMITDTTRQIKGCIWHPNHKPVATILDPELTLSLPRNLTAWTGCDALVHAIEAYCVPAFHPMCDALALQAMKFIGRSLCRAVEQPDNRAARAEMLVGSCLGGVSFLKGLGLVHAISHMIGAECHTHHGRTNAVLLPIVLEFNQLEIEHKVPDIAHALGFASRDFNGFLSEINALLDRIEIPRSLEELGVKPETIDSIGKKASQDPAALTNPRLASTTEIKMLLSRALKNARPLP